MGKSFYSKMFQNSVSTCHGHLDVCPCKICLPLRKKNLQFVHAKCKVYFGHLFNLLRCTFSFLVQFLAQIVKTEILNRQKQQHLECLRVTDE